jgi:hypothetical protein
MAPSDACHFFLVGEAAPGRSSQHNATGLVRLDLMTMWLGPAGGGSGAACAVALQS